MVHASKWYIGVCSYVLCQRVHPFQVVRVPFLVAEVTGDVFASSRRRVVKSVRVDSSKGELKACSAESKGIPRKPHFALLVLLLFCTWIS